MFISNSLLANSTFEDPSLLNLKIQVLIKYREIVRTYLRVNMVHAESFNTCLSDGTEILKSDNSNYNYQSIDGWSQAIRPCETTIKDVLLDKIEKLYPEMKRALVLGSGKLFNYLDRSIDPFFEHNNQRLLYMSKADYTPHHIDSFFSENFGEAPASFSKLSENEILDYHAEFIGQLKNFCEEYTSKYNWQNLTNPTESHKNKTTMSTESERQKFCNKITLGKAQELQNQLVDESNYSKTREAFLIWVNKYKRPNLLNSYLTKYYEILSKLPVLAYLKSPKPSSTELYRAFKIIKINARDVVIKKDDDDVKLNLNERIMYFEKTQSDSDFNKKLYVDLLSYVDYQKFFSMTYSNPELNDLIGDKLDAILDNIDQDWAEKTSRDSMVMISEMIAINLACFMPVGRVARAATNLLMRSERVLRVAQNFTPFCATLTGVPLNLYFFGSAVSEYQKELTEVFSSPEGKYLITDISNLDADASSIVLTSLFFPIGILSGQFYEAASRLSPIAKKFLLVLTNKKE